jgi:uncharacterized phiE125 gp8 family phage protein
MGVTVVTAPQTLAVSLEEAKLHLRVDHADDDALIELFLKAAIANAESFLGRRLIDQTLDAFLDAFPRGGIEVPYPPLIELQGLFYRDSAGNEQEADAATYIVDASSSPARVSMPVGQMWPTTQARQNAVRIRYRAGYLDQGVSPPVANVEPDIKVAILMNLGTLYNSRESIVVGSTPTKMPWGAEELLRRHRVELSMA